MSMFGNLFILIIYFWSIANVNVVCKISNERRCVDPECSVPISVGTTKIRYISDDKRFLSFPQNAKAKIFSKEAGIRPDYWEAEIDGKRGYVPKNFIKEDRMLVKRNEVKLIVPTGEMEKSNQNISKNYTETENLNETPKLPVDNSKGFFGNILGGVSADSVPPNSPDIKPQSALKYQVVDGTTILYDDHVNGDIQESPQVQFQIKETPSTSVPPLGKEEALQQNINEGNSKSLEQNNKEESSEVLNKKLKENSFETLEQNIKEESSDGLENKLKEESSEASEQNIKEDKEGLAKYIQENSSQVLENGKEESSQTVEQSIKEKSYEKQRQLNYEDALNIETNKEQLPAKIMEMPAITQEKPKGIDNINADRTIEYNSESSLLGNLVNSVSNYIASGIGEMKNELDEEEEDEEEKDEEDENGDYNDKYESAAEESDSVLTVKSVAREKMKHPILSEENYSDNQKSKTVGEEVNSTETEIVKEDDPKNTIQRDQENIAESDNLTNAEEVELKKTQIGVTEKVNEGNSGLTVESEAREKIKHPILTEEIYSDYKKSDTVGEETNLTETVIVNKDDITNTIQRDKENIVETDNLSNAEEVELKKTQIGATEKVNVENIINNTLTEINKNVTHEQLNLPTQDKTDNMSSHPDFSSVKKQTVIPEEGNSPNEMNNTSNEQNSIKRGDLSSSANLDINESETVLSDRKDSSEDLTEPPIENIDDGYKQLEESSGVTPSRFGSDSSIDSEIPHKHTNDTIDSEELKDMPNDVDNNLNTKPVHEEPEIPSPVIESNIEHEPLFELSSQNESINSEHPVISEAITQAPAYNHVTSDSTTSSLPPTSDPNTKPLEGSNDLPTPPPDKVSVNQFSNEVIDDVGRLIIEEDSLKVSANSMPDFLDEIIIAEEQIKAKSLQPPLKQHVLNQADSDVEVTKDSISEEVFNNESEGLLSWLNPVFELFKNSDTEQVENSLGSSSDKLEEELQPETQDSQSNVNVLDGSCPSDKIGEGDCGFIRDVTVTKDVMWKEPFQSPEVPATLDLIYDIPLNVAIWLIVTAVALLIFSLGHYYIEAHRRDGPLVAVINKFEREVLILKKENSILEDRLHTVEQELESWNSNSVENDALIVDLKQELEETKAAKLELEEQVTTLEREVESVTENGLEIHRLLEESLSSQDGSQVLLSTVETLREKLEHQEDEIAALSQRLSQKNIEVEELEKKLAQSMEVSAGLEERVIAVTRDKEEEALQLKDKHRQLMAQLEEVIESKALDETRVSAEMSKLRLAIEELQKAVAEKDAELEEVKEVVKQLRSTDSNEKMDSLFDVVGVRAQLRTAITERDDFCEKFHEEEGARKLLEGHMKKITQEVAELKISFETAEKEKIEALTKLQVLSNYFKEKESQLQKELGVQESMWLQKQSNDQTIYEQMRSLREENKQYKLQNESLKKEIVEQESSFKIQIANVEQKSHENWVASRQAERRLKEVQQEAAQLRNRLTIEKNSANYSMEDGKQISESNGDPSSPPPSLMYPPTSSPPFMMYPMPTPPGDFVPPPPLMGSPYPSDSRPPPLGRISSPPLDPRFSPPPPLPYPPFDYPSYGHHSPSPPPPMPSHSHHRNVHKPQPREMSREQKEHMMSNYSPDNDNTVRKNKR